MYRFIAAAFALALCGCTSNSVSSLHYTAGGAVQAVSVATVGGVTATDQRKEAPNRIATIMGGYGNPLKTLDTTKPVKDELADAFVEGLRARGMLAANDQAPFHLALTLRRFDSDQYIGRGARIDLTMAVIDKTGRTIFEDAAKDEESESAFAESGIFGKIEALQHLCEVVMDRSVDKLLDSPRFRAAIAQPSGAGS